MKKILGIIVLGLLLSYCTTHDGMRSGNRVNISKIQAGYSSAQVIETMGTTIASNMGADKFTNPYKTEILTHDNKSYTVWYYYTDLIGDKNWENGMTPVIFLKDSVVAIGWRSMESLGLDSQSSTIRLK
jgi:hypothetical protein